MEVSAKLTSFFIRNFIFFNGENMKIIKFGGTSLQTPTLVNNAIEIVRNMNDKTIIVLSAIGRKGFPYATDTLVNSLKEKYISNKELDRLLTIGEIYSSVFFSNELNKNQVNAYSLSYLELGIKCDNNYTLGKVVSIDTERINQLLEKYEVLVIPGFLGCSNENEIISLGRGTSDYSALLLADSLKQNEVILFKDIDGIYPTIQYPLVKLKCYQNLSYDEALALCDINFPVVNKKALIKAKENGIKIIVKNFILNSNETIISSTPSSKKVLGFILFNNQYSLATFNPQEVMDILDEKFKKSHIFIKNYVTNKQCLSFLISSSQALLIRTIILKTFFSDMIK